MNIKVTTLILSVLVLQTSASFFNGFRGAFETVENSFGKLFNDVMTDVKVTIDCTVLAVQRVFSYGGTFGEPSEYERRCKGKTGDPPEESDVIYDSYTPPAESRSEPVQVTHKIVNEVKKEIAQELDKTMSNVNQTINELLDLSGAQKEIEKVETALKNDTDRLAEISALLRQTIENLSGNMKIQLGKMDLNQNKSTVKDVLKEVKLLQEVENNNTNATEVTEIRRVFNEVLGVLDSDNNYKTLSNYDEVKEIVNGLEKLSNETFTDIEDISLWKNNEIEVLKKIENNVTEDKTRKDVQETTTDLPKSFKDLAKKLFQHPDIVQKKDLVEDETLENPKPTETKKLLQHPDIVQKKDLVEGEMFGNPKPTETKKLLQHPDIVQKKDLVEGEMFGNPKPTETKKLLQHPDVVQKKDLVEDETFGNPKQTEIVTESPPSSTTTETSNYEEQLPDEPTDISQLDISVLNSFFAPPDEESHKEAVKNAAKLIEQSKFSDMIMNDFLKRADEQDMPSVFDNLDLFNFDEI